MTAASAPSAGAALEDWLAWLQALHPRAVDLGLDRVRPVFQRLLPRPGSVPVITVGGTNGKGSTAAYVEAVLRAAGYRTGLYTSPHLWRFTERIRLQGREVDEATLIAALAAVEAQRRGASLTYFEFTTLAALHLFAQAGLDAWVMEVGLGGRLDAVNLLDADVAVITSIALDHTDWLGPDRDSIAREKAGIARPGRPLICGDPDPPTTLFDSAARMGATVRQWGRDFQAERTATGWRWRQGEALRDALPLPALRGAHQLHNAACALAALQALADRLPVPQSAVREGLLGVRLPGRFEILPGAPEWIYDVAHNPAAAQSLAANLRHKPCKGRTHLVFAAQAHKDWAGMLEVLLPCVQGLHCAPLREARTPPPEMVCARVAERFPQVPVQGHDSLEAALHAVRQAAAADDRVVVCGSFYTVAQARPKI